MKWRIAENEFNLKCKPWTDAVGIEEIDNKLVVPAIVCWLARPNALETAQHIIDLHNANEHEWSNQNEQPSHI